MPTRIEIHRLDLRYAELRAQSASRQAKLVASMSADGQRTPVLVVVGESGAPVLIDGFARVAALSELGRDTVDAVVLPLAEAEALVLGHRLETARRRTALEEGWLLAALVDLHGQRPRELAVAFQKTESWVSRRLSLARVLPPVVQAAIRSGHLPANGAEKFLVPLARANGGHCARLVKALGRVKPTVRQLASLYVAWRSADPATRERIVDNPVLYLHVEAATATAPGDEDVAAITGLEAIAGACGRARKDLRQGALHRLPVARKPALDTAWTEAKLAFEAVRAILREEGFGG